MRIGIFGGSFDPPHMSHVMTAQWAVMTGQVDVVWFVPTYRHALGKSPVSFDQRFQWLNTMCDVMGDLYYTSRIEESLPTPSYTINTLDALRSHVSSGIQLRLILGADCWGQRHQWHRWEDIEAHYHPLVVNRLGYPTVDPNAPFLGDMSSSDIRQRIREGQDISKMVPKCIYESVLAAYTG